MKLDQTKIQCLSGTLDTQDLHIMELKSAADLIRELDLELTGDYGRLPSDNDVHADVRTIYKLFELQTIIRFNGQKYWEYESKMDSTVPGKLSLENVAAHTFHVATVARLLAPYFDDLDKNKVVEIALLHDQPEIYIGDRDPIGDDGQGLQTHAFNAQIKKQKIKDELAALEYLISDLRPSLREEYRILFEDFLQGKSKESRFVRAVDKLQSLAFVRLKKNGEISPQHLSFTIRYVSLGASEFPSLKKHYVKILFDLLGDISIVKKQYFDMFCRETYRLIEIAKYKSTNA